MIDYVKLAAVDRSKPLTAKSPATGFTCRLCGASLTGKKGGRFRDVDVRLILPDAEYAALFNDPMDKTHDAPKLMMWNFAWPIDFQIQQQTLANKEFKGSPRSALLILSSELPTVRNA